MRRKRLGQGLDTVEAKAPQSPSAPPAAMPLLKKPAAMKKKAWGLHEKYSSNLTTLFGAHAWHSRMLSSEASKKKNENDAAKNQKQKEKKLSKQQEKKAEGAE